MSPRSAQGDASGMSSIKSIDVKLEVIVIPVSDVDRAKAFYVRLGWRLDQTPPGIVQLTPRGSGCSVQFGPGLTSAAPGSATAYLIVSDIEATRNALVSAGVEVGDIFHVSPDGPVDGLDPERRSYVSRATLRDPDGNTWLMQEITARLPGRIEGGLTSFGSASDLASALKRAAAAHGEHEKRTGERDDDWPDWYARYMVSEQSGAKPPE
ncbi:catechol 2,3-dioxygenase-like lactoylglutathione lyase family enzyme [Micromonospora luteifusca]|uniref:Catechol 2,3-dioxygenase-like lactoylglutathione lyase family enzyme n=1 Tax=Micromonospora luteifusca TaxID=709860 RepID=A0ABS2LMT8_9ACTN|nr:VOC family protein [Micromonospora luteifusca]MBM7489277.1 catechol 2,3-dioxygenase-like lactoylglutathione lyase family enzyme [Micromonospora luteifusca]